MLCRFCFSHRNFGCFDLVCLIVPSTFVIFPIGITVICNIICLWMGNLYAATPGQNPGVARIYIYIYICTVIYNYTYNYIIIYRQIKSDFTTFWRKPGAAKLPQQSGSKLSQFNRRIRSLQASHWDFMLDSDPMTKITPELWWQALF